MSVKANAGKLTKSTKQLMLRWAETKHGWRDGKAQEFEKAYLASLPTSVDSVMRAMAEMDQVITRVRNECE